MIKATKKVTKVSPKVKKALAHKKAVTKNNLLFEKMSPAEKRVQIARDVLEQIKMKKLIPANGHWLNNSNNSNGKLFSINDIEKNKELRDVINKTETCTACALGGLFMCAIKRADDLKVSELHSINYAKRHMKNYGGKLGDYLYTDDFAPAMEDIFEYMERFFAADQIRLIELAFENGAGGVHTESEADDVAANYFYDSENGDLLTEDSTERMLLIMENLIVNKGEFDPKLKPMRVVSYVIPGFSRIA